MPMNDESASLLGNGFDGPARFSLRLFGGFQLALHSGERVQVAGRRERMLLAYLAMSPNCRQPRQKLAVLFWGDSPEEIALHNLRTCVWNLRKGLCDSEHRTIASEGEVIVLDTAAFEIDALAFRHLATNPSQTELEAAANLYSGEFLDGLDIESEELEAWRRTEATRYKIKPLMFSPG